MIKWHFLLFDGIVKDFARLQLCHLPLSLVAGLIRFVVQYLLLFCQFRKLLAIMVHSNLSIHLSVGEKWLIFTVILYFGKTPDLLFHLI